MPELSTSLPKAFTFEEMLAANEAETTRWYEWLKKQPPELLDVAAPIASSETVRTILLHIWGVELRYSDGVADRTPTDITGMTNYSLDELYALHTRAMQNFREWLATATPELLGQILENKWFRASKRKCFLQAMEHGIRHFAQLAVVLRQAGHPTDWGHDIIFNPAIE
ncbi:MAG TPA: DinB family protein [candidate division Zixibacteria bacterium]|nr:DinB family protein [candidate division Zixibacteria bacterium]